MRHAFRKRSFHSVLAAFFQLLHRGCRLQKVHGHVTAAAERGFEFLQREENLAVIVPGVVLRFDINGTDLARVLSGVEIWARADMSVIEAIPGRLWYQRDAAASMRRNVRRAFFRCAIDIGGKKLAMPMELLGRVRLIVNVDRDRFAFLESEQGARELTVVGCGGDDAIRSQFHGRYGDCQGVIRRTVSLRCGLLWRGHCGLAANGWVK
jgi:hypothetical protein